MRSAGCVKERSSRPNVFDADSSVISDGSVAWQSLDCESKTSEVVVAAPNLDFT